MGAAYFIVTEAELPDADAVSDIDGEFIASMSMIFDDEKIYEKLEITPLEEFIGGAGLDFDDEDLGDVANSWFDPADGLKTVRAMQIHISKNSSQFSEVTESLAELQTIEKSLLLCIEHGTRWCLGIDV